VFGAVIKVSTANATGSLQKPFKGAADLEKKLDKTWLVPTLRKL